MTPADFVSLLERERATAILRCGDQATAREAMAAAVRGGFRIVEFTLTIPGVLDLIEEFAAQPGLVVGAGTVLTPAEAEVTVARGARFLVSPVTDPAVIAAAARLGVAMLPGAHTPTEMLAAHRAGAPLIKLFPSPAGGPAYLRSVLAPLPFLKVVPTNGVTQENAAAWFEAGCFALGWAGVLFAREDLESRSFDRIEQRSREILAARPR
jgi:2-dehydro-3-deoxyphosphogluconate aldolase/(4S)-4-hydroxy-2-oxoglutarate aldolase